MQNVQRKEHRLLKKKQREELKCKKEEKACKAALREEEKARKAALKDRKPSFLKNSKKTRSQGNCTSSRPDVAADMTPEVY